MARGVNTEEAESKSLSPRILQFSTRPESPLLQMRTDKFRHLEHRNLGLLENLLELRVGIDHGLLHFILKTVRLNVCPKSLSNLGPRHRI